MWPALSTIRREVAALVSLDEGTVFLKKQGRLLEEQQELRASRFYYALVRARFLHGPCVTWFVCAGRYCRTSYAKCKRRTWPAATPSTEAPCKLSNSSYPSSVIWCVSPPSCAVSSTSSRPLQVTVFARNMGFWALESVFAVFSERVRGGTHADLTELTKIKLVSSKRARALHSSGFCTIESVASADPSLLSKCLRCKAGMQPSGIARDIISHAKRLVISSIRACHSDAARMERLVGQ